MGRWNEEETQLLKELYEDTDNPTLSRILGRSVSAIENKASRMGLKKSMINEEERESVDDFTNSYKLLGREEAQSRDKIDLLRINWSLADMYERELRNPELSEAERHRLMNALSNHTSIINNVMKGLDEELGEQDSLEDRFIEISTREGPSLIKARRVRILVEGSNIAVE